MAAQDFSPLYEKYGAQYNVDPALLASIAQQESGGNADTKPSPQGALGLMQLMPRTAKGLGVDPHDPDQAVSGAARLLSEAMDRNGNVADAVAEYHGGPNRKIWGPKTRAYREAVLGRYQGQSGGNGNDVMQGSTGDDDLLALARGDTPKAPSGPSAPSGPPPAVQSAPASTEDSPDDLLSLARGDAPAAPAGPATGKPKAGESDLPIGETGAYATTGQKAAYEKLIKAHLYDASLPSGSERNPRYLTGSDSPEDVKEGDYYIDQKGQYLRKGGTLKSDMGAGFERGIGDAWQTVGNAISPVLDRNHESEVGNYLEANRLIYGAQHGGDPVSGFGRLMGQTVATGAPVAGLEATGVRLLPEGMNLGARLLARTGIGAGVGAAAAGMTSASSPDIPLAQQLETGAVGGALLSHAAPAVGRVGKWAGDTVRSLTHPLTAQGRDQMAEEAIRRFGEGAPTQGNAAEIVPGSVPTLAQSTANPGIATLERTVKLSRPTAFAERGAQNSEARSTVLEALKGDEHTISDLEHAREAVTAPQRTTAFANAQPADPLPVVAKIDEILASPSGQRDAVVQALTDIKAKLAPEANGSVNPQTDAQQLYGIRQHIGDLLSPLAPSDKQGAKLASRELQQVKDVLDRSIEDAAPGFKQYLSDYADASKAIDEQKFLQSLKVADQRGNITLQKINTALSRIEDMRKKGGVNPAKSLSPQTLEQLKAIQADLLRESNSGLGQPGNSNTAQHIVTGNMAENMNIPMAVGAGALLHHPLLAPAVGVGKIFYGAKKEQVLDALANKLLQPELPMRNVTPPGPIRKTLGAAGRGAQAISPVAGGLFANRLVNPPR